VFGDRAVTCAEISVTHLRIKDIAFKDISEFLVTGTVKFPPSASISSTCGSSDVEVCAVASSFAAGTPDSASICSPTSNDGFYSLSVAHGSSVYIVPSLGNHTFETVAGGTPQLYIDDVKVSVSGQDFYDTTTVIVAVSLHGGNCENYLGEYSVETTSVNGCFASSTWQTTDQERVRPPTPHPPPHQPRHPP
jgi:hypothetical protein